MLSSKVAANALRPFCELSGGFVVGAPAYAAFCADLAHPATTAPRHPA